ncbi:hypothetical protein Q8A67_009386 [Cirrhinus molitorella]|uniref:Uncharacterized protein n=1 Tax=Cirrhinus molitorella TaxID=172907 RepID=A0AA88PYU6_9TELE|nr:hypothetical protein Q8A67_009386 [Cirrhinus molitorella]
MTHSNSFFRLLCGAESEWEKRAAAVPPSVDARNDSQMRIDPPKTEWDLSQPRRTRVAKDINVELVIENEL